MTEFTKTGAVTGLLGNCSVLTMEGYTPIQNLTPGTRVITRNGLRILRDVTTRTRKLQAIRVGKGTLGFSRPKTDMLLAPGQEVMVRDWRAEILFGRKAVIMAVEQLIDGKYISQDDTPSEHELYELRFDEQEVFYADGVEIVSTRISASVSAPDLAEVA